MSDEVSRKAILVLVVLAVLMSLLSTALVMNTIYNAPGSGEQSNTPNAKAVVFVTREPVTGQAVLEVRNNDPINNENINNQG